MSDEQLDPKFSRCLVKRSKYYYEGLGTGLLIALLIAGICIVLAYGVVWCVTNITTPTGAFIVTYLIFVGIFSFMLSTDDMSKFFHNIVNVHIVCIGVAVVFSAMISCYAGIALGISVLIMLVLEYTLMMDVLWVMVIFLATLCVLCPVNFAIGDCLKSRDYIIVMFEKMLSYCL
jgi:hypothetical protein